MLRRLRSSLSGAIVLGAAMIAVIWIGLDLHLQIYRDKAEAAAFQDTSNLARVFEEHIVRVVSEIDKTLLLARNSYLQDPDQFDLQAWAKNPHLLSSFALQLSFIDADGWLKSSTVPIAGAPPNFADREQFRAHAEAPEDAIFIAKPVIGRRSGEWMVLISRGMRDRDGRFRGVIAAALSPGLIGDFYRSIDVGKDGGILLIGRDGVVRAGAGMRTDMIGHDMRDADLFARLDQVRAGSFVTGGRQDGVVRLASYRAVAGMPLVLMVGRSEQTVMADVAAAQRSYVVLACALTLLVLIVVGLSLRNRRRLDSAREALEASEARATNKSRELSITLDNINQGIMMVDAAGQVPVLNGRLIDMLDLPQRYRSAGGSYKEMIAYLWERGEFGPDGANLDPRIRESVRRGDNGEPGVYERVRPDGTVLEVNSVTLPGGSVVRTYSDVTEHRRNLEQIAHMACHDTLTGLVNRVLLRQTLDHSLNRLRRYDEPFAVLCLDLDGFKSVNDTLGHAAGDVVLKSVADRLELSVRDVDTVARLGGDEFTIIMAATADRTQASGLAERILEAFATPFFVDGEYVAIGTSIGIAMAPADGEDVERLLRRADIALYRAKAGGRNRWCFFSPDMEHRNAAAQAADGRHDAELAALPQT